eukprot:6170279-Pyramimonas_sp.AAC.1
MVAARWARHLDAARARLVKLLGCDLEDRIEMAVDLILETHRYCGNVARSQRVLGQLSEDVAQWLLGGVGQMSKRPWTAQVEKIEAEADRLTRRSNGEREKEWRAWAAKSLTGGAGAAHRFTKLPPEAEVRGATARASPHQLADCELDGWRDAWAVHEQGALEKPPDFDDWAGLPRMSI